ncbi:MAG: F-type H+/Na+-transporting ATPase subunit alpha, partial [Mycobacteriales bacterium]
ELEAFAAFGSDLDRASQAQLARGERMVELLKQPAYSPYPVERQVVSLWAGTTGELDDVPVADIRRFEAEFLDFVDHQHEDIVRVIRETGKLSDDAIEQLKKAIGAFKGQFQTAEGKPLKEEAAEAMDAGEVGQEKVTRYQQRPPAPAGSGQG